MSTAKASPPAATSRQACRLASGMMAALTAMGGTRELTNGEMYALVRTIVDRALSKPLRSHRNRRRLYAQICNRATASKSHGVPAKSQTFAYHGDGFTFECPWRSTALS